MKDESEREPVVNYANNVLHGHEYVNAQLALDFIQTVILRKHQSY